MYTIQSVNWLRIAYAQSHSGGFKARIIVQLSDRARLNVKAGNEFNQNDTTIINSLTLVAAGETAKCGP
jgi:hypothetical protein